MSASKNRITSYLQRSFSLKSDKESNEDIVQSIHDNAYIKWWLLRELMIAILICSIGLYTNSVVVIIGAMLISPLMWPIIWIGVGLQRYDFNVVKKALLNLLFAFLMAILVSIVFFFILEVVEPTDEILLRSSSTMFDVFIALFGWLAGMIAMTRKEKQITVVPWAAIAVTLMPPLCVVWYWLSLGEFSAALQSMGLVLVNVFFIIIAAAIVASALNLPRKWEEPWRKADEEKIQDSVE